MQKYVNWYLLQLKAWCQKKTCWFQILGMGIVMGIVLGISLPGTDNLVVGICNMKGDCAEQIVKILEESDSIFSFQRYIDEESMHSDILAGELECGFVFSDELDEKIKKSKVDKSIKYLETPFSTKGAVAKETFYTAFLQVYGEQILSQSVKDVYGREDTEITKELLEKNQRYLDSDEVFRIVTEIVPVKQTGNKETSKTYPVQGFVGLFLFGILFMEHGGKFENRKKKIFKALSVRERRIFEYLGYLAVGTMAAFTGVIVISCSADSRGFWMELVYMVVYLLYSSLWVFVIGRLFRSKTTFMAWTTTLLVMQLLICPVFVDVSCYVKALHYIGYVFPLGIYLRL